MDNNRKIERGVTMLNNKLTELLKIEYPIIQAPMAGGITTSNLVSAVSNAGGLGMMGAGYMTPAQIREEIRDIKGLTTKPFGINLFVPSEFEVNESEIEVANEKLKPFQELLNVELVGMSEIPTYEEVFNTFKEQIKIVIEEKVPICSFTFGIPSKEVIADLKEHQIILIGTATTVKEAIAIEKAGMDLVVVQGSEAGGHRGNFINEHQESLIGLMSLIPQVADHVSIPVISAGGIMDGRGLMASLCLGAKGVQMGTAFLTCVESGAHEVHKEAILNASEDQTVLTRAFSGKYARGLNNKYIQDMQTHEEELPDFPVQNKLTQKIRGGAGSQGNSEYMSLWSGQSVRLAEAQTVKGLIDKVINEAKTLKD